MHCPLSCLLQRGASLLGLPKCLANHWSTGTQARSAPSQFAPRDLWSRDSCADKRRDAGSPRAHRFKELGVQIVLRWERRWYAVISCHLQGDQKNLKLGYAERPESRRLCQLAIIIARGQWLSNLQFRVGDAYRPILSKKQW